MSMAEDTRNRPDYSSEPHPSKSALAGDPLAELARLIGQSDPFAELGKRGPSGTTRNPLAAPKSEDRPAPEWLARPASTPEPDENDYPAVVRAGPRDDYADPYDHAATDDTHAHFDAPQPAKADDAPAARYQDPPAPHRYATPLPAAQTYVPAHADTHEQAADPYAGDDRYDDRYRVTPPAGGEYDHDGYYADDSHMPPGVEGPVAGRRRGGIITIAAVLGLAVIGTAGAFGYRAFTSGSGSSSNPPVIKADPTPAKTVPPAAPATADAQGKPYQDRIAALAAGERVVPREEQPVAVPVAPAVRSAAPPSQSISAAPAPLVAPPPSANEPKRVKTLTIRQEAVGSDTGGITAPAAAPSQNTRSPAPAATKQSGPAPLAIAPPSDQSARTKVAVRTPPSVAAGGAYAVQVSAQKSEAEAQSSYQSLQAKYPSVLGGKQASIRRVDLGDKGGVFYRAQVGTFATADQANAFCGDLKAAGGQCIVQKN